MLLNASDPNLLVVYIYKLVVVLLGAGSILLGYRLFIKGITAPAGDMEVDAGEKGKLKLAHVAPGIFFALFGAVVIIVGVSRPFTFREGDAPDATATATDTMPTPSHHSDPSGSPAGTVIKAKPALEKTTGAKHTVFLCDTCAN